MFDRSFHTLLVLNVHLYIVCLFHWIIVFFPLLYFVSISFSQFLLKIHTKLLAFYYVYLFSVCYSDALMFSLIL